MIRTPYSNLFVNCIIAEPITLSNSLASGVIVLPVGIPGSSSFLVPRALRRDVASLERSRHIVYRECTSIQSRSEHDLRLAAYSVDAPAFPLESTILRLFKHFPTRFCYAIDPGNVALQMLKGDRRNEFGNQSEIFGSQHCLRHKDISDAQLETHL